MAKKQSWRKLSLLSRITNLLSTAPQELPKVSDEEIENGNISTTIRFDPVVHSYFSTQADHLGTSLQSVVSMVLKSVMMDSVKDVGTELYSLCQRFRYIFSVHGISDFDIPKFVPGIKRSQLLNDKELLNVIDNQAIELLAQTFEVDIDWLKGVENASVTKYGLTDWYKNIDSVLNQISKHRVNCEEVTLHFITKNEGFTSESELLHRFATATDREDGGSAFEITVAIETVKEVNGGSIPHITVMDAERWNYTKLRMHMLLLVQLAQGSNIRLRGHSIASPGFVKIQFGEAHPIELLSMMSDRDSMYWSPEFVLNDKRIYRPHEYQDMGLLSDRLLNDYDVGYFDENPYHNDVLVKDIDLTLWALQNSFKFSQDERKAWQNGNTSIIKAKARS